MQKITLTNSYDEEDVIRGHRRTADVRSTEIEALVDTGATMMVLPADAVSRLGLLPAPPVPGIVLRDPSDPGGAAQLAKRVSSVVSATLAGVPVPVVIDGPSVTVLLSLVEPPDSAAAATAVRAEFAGLQVYQREFTMAGLCALGPLAGRLGAHQATGGRP